MVLKDTLLCAKSYKQNCCNHYIYLPYLTDHVVNVIKEEENDRVKESSKCKQVYLTILLKHFIAIPPIGKIAIPSIAIHAIPSIGRIDQRICILVFITSSVKI